MLKIRGRLATPLDRLRTNSTLSPLTFLKTHVIMVLFYRTHAPCGKLRPEEK